MKEQITPELFNHLVDLAALEMNPQEADYLRNELNSQLNAIQELESIPLDAAIPPSLHGITYTHQTGAALREDDWQPYENAPDILQQVPELIDGYIVVPDIPHTTLE